MSNNYLDTLAEFICETTLSDIDPSALLHLRHIIADTLAACAVGNQESSMRELLRIQHEECKAGLATVIGTSTTINPMDAAMLNASAGCWLELDEGNLASNGHPGIQVIPTALAVAQHLNSSGSDFLLASAIGYEVCARIGMSCEMRMSIHPHGTYGVVGAAVAAGKLYGLELNAMRELVNLAGSSPLAGNRQSMKEGATVRNWYASHSASMGQMAVRLIQSGFTGPRDGLTPTCDDVLFDHFRPDVLIKDLGRNWVLADGYIKLYGCGRPIHAAIDALRVALETMGPSNHWPNTEEIEAINIRGFKFLVFLNSLDIRNAFSTRFSTPFALASVLVNRSYGIECFDEYAAHNPMIHSIMKRISLTEDASFTTSFPGQQLCEVKITYTNGRQLIGKCEIIRGEPSNPARPEEYYDKFVALTSRVWPEREILALYDAAFFPEKLNSLRGLGGVF